MLKKRCAFLFLALVIFLSGFFPIAGTVTKAAASTAEYDKDLLYYFTDFYSELSYDELVEEFDNYDVIVDRQNITEEEFYPMIDYLGYFDELRDSWGYRGVFFILDIKTFMPDADALEYFFNKLDSRGYGTAFITVYRYPKDSAFIDHLDLYCSFEGDFERLYRYIDAAMYQSGMDMMTSIILDANLIDLDTFWGADLTTLSNNSIFLKILLQRLYYYFYSRNDSLFDIEAFAEYLINQKIKILVNHSSLYEFIDILTWTPYYYRGDWLTFSNEVMKICALGFWSFTFEYYQVLYDIQKQRVEIPMWALVIDHMDDGGLYFISDRPITGGYHEIGKYLLKKLHTMLG